MAEVSFKLGHTDPEWFARNRARLIAEEGFPGPVPGMGLRWDPAAIDLSHDRNIPAHLRPAPTVAPIAAPAPANDTGADEAAELAAQRAELLRRVPGSVAAMRGGRR